jgi:NAD(P)H-dependent FMN reductase
MAMVVKVLLINGSLRSGSTNAAVLATAAAGAGDRVKAVTYGAMAGLPHFNPDDDVDPLPPAVEDLRGQIAAADALLICTPEYAGALPGSFKNLLDWTVGGMAIQGKPVAWVNVSASPTGAEGAHQSLRIVLQLSTPISSTTPAGTFPSPGPPWVRMESSSTTECAGRSPTCWAYWPTM